jgi:hypothetical protein
VQRRIPFRCWLIAGIAILLVWTPLGATQARAVTEPELKAAFVLNFARFIEWPASAFERGPKVQICASSNGPLADALEQAAADKTIDGRPVQLRVLKPNDAHIRECHILVIESADKGALLEATKGAPVLTIGNGTRFAEQGGVIDFITDHDTVRFEINPDAAERAQLKISSKLLALAKIVRSNGQL